jgi:hypothetical protein
MTMEADFKRLVRQGAAETGEPYQVARRQLRPERPVGPPTDDELRIEFLRTGIIRLSGVFSEAAAAQMRDVLWEGWRLVYGVERDDASTWGSVEPWRVLKGPKRHPIFREVLGPRLRQVADILLGPGWTTSSGFGGLLCGFPDTDRWFLPGASALWHSDALYVTPMSPLGMLRIFAVFGDLRPGGGGTLLVEGSHHMVERFVQEQPDVAFGRAKAARAACHRSNPWLAELTTETQDRSDERRYRFMDNVADVDGIPARVIEVCGVPGDVFVCHPWTIHCRPPNAGTEPRFIRSPTLSHRPPPAALNS